MRFGMGIKVASLEQQQAAAAKTSNGLTNMMMFVSEPKPTGALCGFSRPYGFPS